MTLDQLKPAKKRKKSLLQVCNTTLQQKTNKNRYFSRSPPFIYTHRLGLFARQRVAKFA
jgi:hypothetical protein